MINRLNRGNKGDKGDKGEMKFSDTKYGDLTGQDITIPIIKVSKRGIDDLTGSPEIVRGDFICYTNNLLNLKNSPKEIYGFTCLNSHDVVKQQANPGMQACNLL